MSENTENRVVNNVPDDNNEIDLVALIKRLWSKRKFIIYVTAGFIVVGLFVALFSAKEYTAGCLFVPQTSSKTPNGSMSSLAALAGINLNQMNTEQLSPMVYPQILSNVDFKKELMYSKIRFEKFEEPVSILDYYTNEEYNKPSIGSYVLKYTIGLPGLIIKAIKGEDKIQPVGVGGVVLNSYTEEEYECSKILSDLISLTINDKDGYLELSVDMPEAAASAEVATIVFELLEKYITDFKIAKAQATLNFVDARLEEARAEFAEKQVAYAKFRDANRSLNTATAQIEETRLRQEYDLANTIFTELARQKTQVELQVKEDTPVLSVVKPIVVPFERSKPKRALIMVAFAFLGGCAGCGLVFGFDYLKKQGSSWPGKWTLEDYKKAEEEV